MMVNLSLSMMVCISYMDCVVVNECPPSHVQPKEIMVHQIWQLDISPRLTTYCIKGNLEEIQRLLLHFMYSVKYAFALLRSRQLKLPFIEPYNLIVLGCSSDNKANIYLPYRFCIMFGIDAHGSLNIPSMKMFHTLDA